MSKEKAAEDAPPKKSKKKLIIIILAVVLLGGGYEAKSILLKPHFKPGQHVPAGQIVPLASQLTVNLSDGHLVQVSIALQLTSVALPATITTDMPRFEDAIITDFGSQTYKGLLAPTGRTEIKSQILKDCQKITGTVDGAAPQITAVYFTSFVIQ
jgi:flagellar FliL protein